MDWVPKKETSIYRQQFSDAFIYVRSVVNEYKYYFRLTGSAKRNLVLRHHNKNFDLDYQIVFYNSIRNEDYAVMKGDFIRAFDDFFTKKGYKNAEDSTSAITIKKIEQNTIHDGYDITLISPENDGLYILKYIDEEKTQLDLVKLKQSYPYMTRYKDIHGQNMWIDLRNSYKKKRENNTENKKSFSLLAEAVKELFDKYEKEKNHG